MPFTLSPNMNLPIPTVGQEPGPDYASDVNASLTLVDLHDHASGSGVQITPAGLNISSDLGFISNNATALRSVRFTPQGAVLSLPADLGCLYEVNDDLYYNDGVGNQIRITQSGGVAGTPGSIANLVPPASASYVSADSTFVWESDANIPANMDAASYIFRNLTLNSFGVTVSPPNALAANYSLVLPSVPLVKNIVTLDASGNFGSALNVDGTSLEWSGDTLSIKNDGVTTAKISDQNVTFAKVLTRAVPGATAGVGQVAVTPGSGNFTTTSGAYVNVTNLSISITTIGGPVRLYIVSDPAATVSADIGSTASDIAEVRFLRDGSVDCGSYKVFSGSAALQIGATLEAIDVPAAGAHSYNVQLRGGASGVALRYYRFVAYEM